MFAGQDFIGFFSGRAREVRYLLPRSAEDPGPCEPRRVVVCLLFENAFDFERVAKVVRGALPHRSWVTRPPVTCNEASPCAGQGAVLVFAGAFEDAPLSVSGRCGGGDPSHSIVFECAQTSHYRVVRRRGREFIKLFTDRREALREAAVHWYLENKSPGVAVPFTGLFDPGDPRCRHPGLSIDADEFQACILTAAPEEPAVLLRDIACPERAERAVGRLLDTLDSLFASSGFVHGDVHGGNVLVADADDRALLLDFGMSEIHAPEQRAWLRERHGVDVGNNSWTDTDIHLDVVHPDVEGGARMSRAEFLHHYDRGRAILGASRRFAARLAERYMKGADAAARVASAARSRSMAANFVNYFSAALAHIDARLGGVAGMSAEELIARKGKRDLEGARLEA